MSLMVHVCHICGPFSHQHVHHLNPSQLCIEDARFYSSIKRVSRGRRPSGRSVV